MISTVDIRSELLHWELVKKLLISRPLRGSTLSLRERVEADCLEVPFRRALL